MFAVDHQVISRDSDIANITDKGGGVLLTLLQTSKKSLKMKLNPPLQRNKSKICLVIESIGVRSAVRPPLPSCLPLLASGPFDVGIPSFPHLPNQFLFGCAASLLVTARRQNSLFEVQHEPSLFSFSAGRSRSQARPSTLVLPEDWLRLRFLANWLLFYFCVERQWSDPLFRRSDLFERCVSAMPSFVLCSVSCPVLPANAQNPQTDNSQTDSSC